jgi:FkbH-like protein
MAEGPVRQHEDRQLLLRRLAAQGTVLIGLSKGSPGSVRWAETSLDPADFAVLERSWRPKAVGLEAALEALNIRPGQVGVIDDSPAERSLLAASFPELTMLDADDPRTWRRLGLACALGRGTVTADGARRAARYRTALTRRRFMAGQPLGGAMAELGLRLTFGPLKPDDVTRTAELLRRTNQFNTTGLRVPREALARMAAGAGAEAVYVASLSDRFGDFGLVAAVIVDTARRSIASFVLSCRAMGYGVEQVVLDRVVTEHGTPIEARLVPTRLNEPCHGVFASAGFRQDSPGLWRLAERYAVRVPSWVSVEDLRDGENSLSGNAFRQV